MRFPKRVLAGSAGLVVVSLVGCSSPAQAPGPNSGSAPPPASSSVTGPASSSATAAAPEPGTKSGARAAAAEFYRLYSAGQFSASWGLLSPAAKQAVPRAIWTGVHNGCQSAGAGTARVIKSVLVFGNAAIVTETIAGADSRLGEAEDVFNYVNGHWEYTPNNLGIYHHGSVAADILSAKLLGLCTGRTAAPL